MFDFAVSTYGKDALIASYAALWTKWAEQLAYAFVHRLPHGVPSASNLCLDGRLADFGTTTAVPTWAKVVNTFGHAIYGKEMSAMAGVARSLAYFFGRHLDARMTEPDALAAHLRHALATYDRTVMVEFMRVFGLSRPDANDLVRCEGKRVARVVDQIRRHFLREKLDALSHMPTPMLPGDLWQVWAEDPPTYLQSAAELLRSVVAADCQSQAAGVCRFRTRPREALYRQELTDRIGLGLEDTSGSPDGVREMIHQHIAAGRRDCALEPERAVPIGFAYGDKGSYALFRDMGSGESFALAEWNSSADRTNGTGSADIDPLMLSRMRHPISRLDCGAIHFEGGERFVGSAAFIEDVEQMSNYDTTSYSPKG